MNAKTIFIVYSIFMMFLVIILIKYLNTTVKRCNILDAIEKYNQQEIENHCLEYTDEPVKLIPYRFSKTYYETLFNLFDWGYKNLVPPDVYEKIKPYL